MNRLKDVVALVTGASRGLGESIALLFAEEGARVVVADVLEEEGKAVAEAIGDEHLAIFRRLDVTSAEQWQQAVKSAETAFGKLDVLVNNAGIVRHVALDDPGTEKWDQTIAVNQTGTFLGIKHVVPAMRRAGGGSIVNVSSTAGLVGIPGSSWAYSASKGAVRLMTKSAAIELASDNIRVNSVHPGRIWTEMTSSQPSERAEFLDARTPLARSGFPREVAYGVLFLASGEASYITGAELAIDGGYTAQ
jgi:NAD(P)-dependent dehydrogenase (short-subunit alcohol dehydrogenase family)